MIVFEYHNVMLSQYQNMFMTRTENHPLYILRTLFDTVFNAVSGYGYNPERSLQKYMFYKWGHIASPKGSPDIILDAFDVKSHEENNGLRPKAQTKSQKPETK